MHRSTGEDGPMVIAGATAEDGPMVIADNIGVDSGDTAIMSSWSMNCKHYRLAISEALRYPTRVFFRVQTSNVISKAIPSTVENIRVCSFKLLTSTHRRFFHP
jgi:hypothetical protein